MPAKIIRLFFISMEFDFIEKIRRKFPQFIGDDCAVLVQPDEKFLLLTVDELVENIHFKCEYFSMNDIGYKSVSAACSDIAAMGGNAIGILVSLSLPIDFNAKMLENIYSGIDTFCNPLGISVLGGNITQSDCGLHVVTSVLGYAKNPIFRRNAKSGEKIFVTGMLGGSIAGFLLLEKRLKARITRIESSLLKIRHRRPRSRMEAGKILGDIGVSSMIDISDGLISDLSHIADESGVGFHESGVGFRVDLGKLPIFPGVAGVADAICEPLQILAARSGEEFELIFTTTNELGEKASKILSKELDVPVTCIGEICKGERIILFEGEEVNADKVAGWEHLASQNG